MQIGTYLQSTDTTFLNCLLALISLPLLSRPATAVLDMSIGNAALRPILAEWMYLVLLMLLLLLTVHLLFRWRETSWQKQR